MNKKENVVQIKKDWWKSSNFWVLAALFATSLFIGRGDIEPLIQQIIGGISAVISGGMLFRNMLKDGKFKLEWSRVTNTVAYLGLIINGFVEQVIPPETWDYLSTIVEGLMAGNWQQAIGSVIPLLAIVINLIKGNKKPVEG